MVPQVPQLVASVCVFEQVPAQFVVPLGHPHWPALHTRLLPQICEQRPQFCLLFCRSTHWFPHCVKPDAEQRTAQVPSLQMGSVVGH